MTPKEKAKELVDKYKTYAVMWSGGVEVENQNAKACAIICVDEILINNQNVMGSQEFTTEYENRIINHWQQVKEEINNL